INKDRQSISVGEFLQISALVHLGALDQQHVGVEAYHGEVDNGDLRNPTATVLNQSSQADGNGNYIYQGSVPATESGSYGFSVRVVPTHPCLMQAHELRLITWSYSFRGAHSARVLATVSSPWRAFLGTSRCRPATEGIRPREAALSGRLPKLLCTMGLTLAATAKTSVLIPDRLWHSGVGAAAAHRGPLSASHHLSMMKKKQSETASPLLFEISEPKFTKNFQIPDFWSEV